MIRNKSHFSFFGMCLMGACLSTVMGQNMAPTFTLPPNVRVACELAEDLAATGSPTNIMDDSDPAPVVSFADERVNGSCPADYFITREWRVTDSGGLYTTGTQIIEVIDNSPPQLRVAPKRGTHQRRRPNRPIADGAARRSQRQLHRNG